MEIVLRLRRQSVIDIHWERRGRACLLLALSCFLYWYIRVYAADYTAEWEDSAVYAQELKLDGSMDGIHIVYVRGNVDNLSALYRQKPENAAACRLAEYRELSGIADRVEYPSESRRNLRALCRIENIEAVRNVWDAGIIIQQDEEDRVSFSENGERIENDILFRENEEETKNDISFIETEEIKNDTSSIENGEETKNDISPIENGEETKNDISPIENGEGTKNDISSDENGEGTKNDISSDETEEGIKNDISSTENEKETEDDMSFIQGEDTFTDENGEIREIAGFYVDNQGYIVGITENLSFMDGILAVASDSECVGIRENAFSNVEDEVVEIYIPANICDIEPGAFDVFGNLMYIEVAVGNRCYCSIDGILYTKSGGEIAYPAGRY